VTGYVVRRNGVQIATPTTISFADTGLSAATTYSYSVGGSRRGRQRLTQFGKCERYHTSSVTVQQAPLGVGCP